MTTARFRVIQGRSERRGGPESPSADPRLEALRSNDPAVVEEVLRELLPSVRRWLLRHLGPRPDLDDAVQDALTEIALALPRYEGRSSLSTHAHKITARVAYRYYGTRRKRQAETALELVAPPPDEIDPESRAMGREALRRLYRCLDKLPRKRRAAFVLCCVEGLSPTDAAEVAGVSPTAMRSRLMHARHEVSRMLRTDPYVSALLGSPPEGGG